VVEVSTTGVIYSVLCSDVVDRDAVYWPPCGVYFAWVDLRDSRQVVSTSCDTRVYPKCSDFVSEQRESLDCYEIDIIMYILNNDTNYFYIIITNLSKSRIDVI
jgi:hypothetical protein